MALAMLTKLFGGNKSEKDVRELQPYVGQINEFYDQLKDLSHDKLRGKSDEFRGRIKDHLKQIDSEMESLKQRAESDEANFDEKEELYKEIDELEKKRDEQLEEILLKLLPEAFAVMKETAFRYSKNSELVVSANELDRNLATKVDFITIEDDKAVYKNTWNVRGIPHTWNMVHYDVQLIGGVVLHQGKIAEMATGEGKTLVATLPAYLNALAGNGVHIVTVNDYLSRRDCEWNRPLFNFLGITSDCIDYHQPHTEERRNAYLSDITYGTNNEFGFDYLRDNMVRSPEEMVQRKLHYAMVDEVDSVLVDDARTPLIISGPVGKGGDSIQFEQLKPRVVKLVEAQKRAVNQFLNEAKKLIEANNTGNDDGEGGMALLRAHRGLPKTGSVIKYLSEDNHRTILQKTENYYVQDSQKNMPKVDAGLYFTIDEKNKQVELTEKGIELITESGEDKHFFVMPDVGSEMAEIEKAEISPEEKIKQKDALLSDFGVKSERIHAVQQLLKAYSLFDKDIEYVVMDGKIKIVDEQTGRILEGRRYSDGLHEAIEAKESVKIEAATQTFATVTLQNYFRMYHKLAGMTGTAETEAQEFWQIYKLDVVVIPTHKKLIRKDAEDLVYRTKREKYNSAIEEITKLRNEGRPVLVGTTSVEVSELLSRMLKLRNIKHNVLNAKQHQREAEVVAEAGLPGAVTIATNMAGRGTDIKLGQDVPGKGGLAIIGTERHDSRRVDRQLRGRSARQGDPGSTQFYVSLEDDLMRIFGSERIAGLMTRMGYKEGETLQHRMISNSIERAQRKVEENNYGIRKRLLEYDDVMNAQRDVIYKKRRHALFGERLTFDLYNMFFDLGEELVIIHRDAHDYENFRLDVIRFFATNTKITENDFYEIKQEELAHRLYDEVMEVYKRKCQYIIDAVMPQIRDLYEKQSQYENIVIPFSDGIRGLQTIANIKKSIETNGREIEQAFEKGIALGIIDDAWKEHLRQMDELKQSVQSAVYEQKDPLLIYKFEAFELFKKMISHINREVTSFLFKGNLPVMQQQPVQHARAPHRSDFSRMRESRENTEAITNPERYAQRNGNGNGNGEQQEEKKLEPIRVGPKIGRNDPCPCGSGKKYKNCHGK